MRRTTLRHRRAMTAFFADNRRLFPFVGLFLLGVLLGVIVYVTGGEHITADWGRLLRVNGVAGGFSEGLHALWGACFSSLLLLAALFLLGMWSCGAPFVLLVPLIKGVGLGLTEAYYYSSGSGGVAAVAAVIMPGGLLSAAVLVMAGVESLRLCMTLGRQLLPGTVSAPPAASTGRAAVVGGELWTTFRLYCLRFLLFILAAIGAGVLEVLLRIVFSRLLS